MAILKKKNKEKPLTTNEMEVAIAKYFNVRLNIIVPNISWGLAGMHECDMFIIKRSGVAVEVEIKRTKSDFLADFKKGHDHKDKFNRITEFYYAFPLELLDKCIDLVPEHAGIFVCKRYGDNGIVKAHLERKPTKIKNSRKLTIEEQLKVAKLGTMRIWSLKEKLIKLNNNGKK